MCIKKILLIASIIISYFHSYSQILECGTVSSGSFTNNTNTARVNTIFPTNTLRYYPIQFHIVKESDETGGLSSSVPTQILSELNEAFSSANIQFYSCDEIDVINNDLYYNHITTNNASLASTYNNDNALDVYFFNSLYNGFSYLAGQAYYPWTGTDLILVINSYASNGSTIIHEMGHSFGLLHTHESSSYYGGKEFVNGSNCATAGDSFCDTPADPKLSHSLVSLNCEYIGTSLDVNNDPYQPNTHNYMSYSRSSCKDEFSFEQLAEVSYWGNSVNRSHMIGSTIVSNETITSSRIIANDLVIINNTTLNSSADVLIEVCNTFKIENTFEAKVGSQIKVYVRW